MGAARTRNPFAEFMRARHGALVRFAYLLTGDTQTAEDLSQIAFERLYARWRRFEGGSGAETYLRRTITNLVIDQGRQRGREAARVAATSTAELMSPDPAPSIDAKVDVASALWLLPPRQRAVLVLRFYAGLSLQETSMMLGISLSAVKTHSQRGLAQLRATGYLTTGSDHDGR